MPRLAYFCCDLCCQGGDSNGTTTGWHLESIAGPTLGQINDAALGR
jgi:hypothetical protein